MQRMRRSKRVMRLISAAGILVFLGGPWFAPRASAAKSTNIAGLSVSGSQPTLRWHPVSGAHEYTVTVVPGDGFGRPWIWQGRKHRVAYGEIVPDPNLFVGRALAASLRSVTARPGVVYRWMVIALDRNGQVVATSDSAEFTCSDPCGLTS